MFRPTCRRIVRVAALAFVFALVYVGTAEAVIVTNNLLYNWDASDGTNATAATWTSAGLGASGTTKTVWTINDGTTQRVQRQAVLSSTTMTDAYDFTGWVNAVSDLNGTATRGSFDTADSDVTDNTASFEFWIKPDAFLTGTNNRQMIFETGGVQRGFNLSLWGDELKLALKTEQTTAGWPIDPPDVLTHTLSAADLTDFLQVVVTLENSTDQARLYVNPLSESAPSTAKDATGAGGWAGDYPFGSSDSSLGGMNVPDSTSEFGGGSDDAADDWYANSAKFVGYEGQTGIVRVYNDILTGSEVAWNFNATAGNLKYWRGGDPPSGTSVIGWQADENWYADLAGTVASTKALSGDVVVLHTTTTGATPSTDNDRQDILQINNHANPGFTGEVRGFVVLPGATFDATARGSVAGTFEVREGGGSTEGTLTLTDALVIDFQSGGTPTNRTLDFRADGSTADRNDYNLAFSNSAGAIIDVEGSTDEVKISFDIVNASPTNAATITKTGAGTLELYGPRANTYSGNWVVEGGTLELNKTAGLNAIVGDLTVGDGTGTDTVKLLKANQIANTSDVTVNAGGVFDLNGNNETIGGLSGDGTVDNSAAASGATLTVGSGNATSTFSGEITNGQPLSLTKTGTGKLTLTGDSSYAGATSISKGTLNIQHANALGLTGSGTTVSTGATLEMQGGITTAAEPLTLNGDDLADGGALRSLSGNNTFSGPITLASNSRIQSDANTLTLDVASGNAITGTGKNLALGGEGNMIVEDPIDLGTGLLKKQYAGTVTLNAANTFIGGVIICNGELGLGDDNALGAGTNALIMDNSNPGKLWLNGHSVTLTGLRFDAGTPTDGDSVVENTATTDATLTVDLASGTNTYQDILQDGGSGKLNLIKKGAGTLILDNLLAHTNTYTGKTDIDAGTLLINGTHTGVGTYTVASGATLGGSGTTNNATVIIETGGILSPGESIGDFGVGAVTLKTGSTLDIEFNVVGDFDVLNVIGTATLGGTLVLHTPPGFDPPFCEEFVVLTADTLIGEFDEFDTSNVHFASLAMGWEIVYNQQPGTVTLHVVPEPASLSLLGLGGLALLARRRRRR